VVLSVNAVRMVIMLELQVPLISGQPTLAVVVAVAVGVLANQ